MISQLGFFKLGNRRAAIVGLCVLLFGLAATGARVIKQYHAPGPFSHDNAGFCDFHNGLYFPTQALIDGVSPYGKNYVDNADYPVSRQLPFFSPAILLAHIPLAILPLRVAEIFYAILLLGLIMTTATVVASLVGKPGRLDWIVCTAAALVMARGGHSTLYDGYFTFELVLATILAVHWAKDRPLLAALALVIVSAKPTYILPLGFLLLARGNYKALSLGALFSILAAGIPFAWLSYHEGNGNLITGFATVIQEIGASQDFHLTVLDETPLHTWTRVDLFAIAAKWLEINPSQTFHMLIMFPLLMIPMFVLHQRRFWNVDDGATGLTGLVVFTAMLGTVYHHSYDCLVLILPMVAILAGRTPTWWRHKGWVSSVIVALIAVPFYNYISTQMFLTRVPHSPLIFKVLTSVSGVALGALMLISCELAWRVPKQRDRLQVRGESEDAAIDDGNSGELLTSSTS